MQTALQTILSIWFALLSAVALILTVYDKAAAKLLPRLRIPEATLMSVGALGGALVMYITMQLIRHKTQHKQFMIGLPLLMLLHLLLGVLAIWASINGIFGGAA